MTLNDVATEAVLAAISYSGDQNGLHLVQAAKLVCQDLFDEEASFTEISEKTVKQTQFRRVCLFAC